MALKVAFHPLARADLFDLYRYIEDHSGALRAGAFIGRIEALCRSLDRFPERGVARDDLGIGVRTVAIEHRVLVVYRCTAEDVDILRIIYAGRDYAAEDVPD